MRTDIDDYDRERVVIGSMVVGSALVLTDDWSLRYRTDVRDVTPDQYSITLVRRRYRGTERRDLESVIISNTLLRGGGSETFELVVDAGLIIIVDAKLADDRRAMAKYAESHKRWLADHRASDVWLITGQDGATVGLAAIPPYGDNAYPVMVQRTPAEQFRLECRLMDDSE